ncbi:MAG: hypothetical protein K6C94_01840 [Candidatus Gastranaerophilales bacterium]|nr:hypothetical protein [Candidatus Gastranaerophilales bacterium]
MDKIIKIAIFAALVYGVFWVSQNVDFNKITDDMKQKMENEKTVTRVHDGRDRARQDALDATTK